MIGEYGGLETAKQLLRKSEVLQRIHSPLTICERLDLSVEAVVLQEQWRPLFTDEELLHRASFHDWKTLGTQSTNLSHEVRRPALAGGKYRGSA